MVSGASFLYGKELVVSSKWYGKLATVLFYSAIVISLLAYFAYKYYNNPDPRKEFLKRQKLLMKNMDKTPISVWVGVSLEIVLLR